MTLDEVLAWAEQTLAPALPRRMPSAPPPSSSRASPSSDLGLDGSGLDALTLASLRPRRGAARAGADRRDAGHPLERWQALVDAQGLGVTSTTTLRPSPISTPRASTSSAPASTPCRCDSLPIAGHAPRRPAHDRSSSSPARPWAHSTSRPSTPARDRAVRQGRRDRTALDPQSFLLERHRRRSRRGRPGLGDRRHPPDVDARCARATRGSRSPRARSTPTSPRPRRTPIGCDGHVRCGQIADFRYTFDPGPGEPTTFAAPTASLTTPAGTSPYLAVHVGAPAPTLDRLEPPVRRPDAASTARGSRSPLPETAGGTVLAIKVWFTVDHEPRRRPGDRRADQRRARPRRTTLTGDAPRADLRRPRPQPAWTGTGRTAPPRAAVGQSGLLRVDLTAVPRSSTTRARSSRARRRTRTTTSSIRRPPGKRLVVSTNATDGQISLVALLAGRRDSRRSASQNAGLVAGHAGRPSRAARRAAGRVRRGCGRRDRRPDARRPGGRGRRRHRAGRGRVDGCRRRRAAARARDERQRPAERGALLAARAVPRRAGRDRLHAVRARCRRTSPRPARATRSTAATNTVYLFDTRRFTQTYGEEATVQVRAALDALTDTGHVGAGTVAGRRAVGRRRPAVRAARAALDANPCSMPARAHADRRDQRLRRRSARRRPRLRSRRS